MTRIPDAPGGAPDHPGFTAAEHACLRELAGKIAAASSTVTDQAPKPVVHVTFWSVTERDLAVRAMGVVASPSSDAAEGAGDIARCIETIDKFYAFKADGGIPLQNCGEWIYLKKLLLNAPPNPAPDAMREALTLAREEMVLAIAFLGRDVGTERQTQTLHQLIARLATADKAARKALVAPVPSPDGAGESDAEHDIRMSEEESRDNLRLIDFIADKIGLSHGEELSRENFNTWLSTLPPSPTGAAEPDAVQAALIKRVSDAWQITLTEPSESWETQPPMNERYTQYVLTDAERAQLRNALSAAALHGEQHTARFLARLAYRRGVAYGEGLESEDAWVDANWRFFREDARRLGGIAYPVASHKR